MTTQHDLGADIESVVESILKQEEAEQQAATTASTSEQQAAPAATDTQGQGTTEGEGAAAEAAAAPAPAAAKDDHGDVRGALRAARRSERQARERAAQLEAELEEARKRIPAAADTSVTDAELAELETDMPTVAKALKEVRARTAAAANAPAPAPTPTAQPDFTPPAQPPEVQDLIDDIPDLLVMQHDPDQAAFKLAVQTDALLREHPKWADKPLAERLAECARRVKAELGAPAASPAPQPPAPQPAPAPTARRAPAAAVADAPVAKPTTLSDIAGGAAPTTESPGLSQFLKMSNEDIMAALERHG